MKCRVCGREICQSEIIKNIKDDCNRYYFHPTKLYSRDAQFYWCADCGLGQLEYVLGKGYYENYNGFNSDDYMSIGRSNVSYHMGFYRKIIDQLSGYNDHVKLLDIGCGKGDLLTIAKEFYVDVKGVESSESQAKKAIDKGLDVKVGFFSADYEESGFDAFVITQVLEHLENPMDMLKNAYNILRFGGAGYIDVPNGEMIWNTNRYFDVFCEHINYWSVFSLAKALNAIGFTIISIGEILNGNHIGAYVKKCKKENSFLDKLESDADWINKLIKMYKIVSFWGAGVKGSVFLRFISDMSHIKYVFDSDEKLEGKYMEGVDIPISRPEAEKINENDLIIISAVEHKYTISEILKNEYGYKGRITCIDDLSEEQI